MRRGEAGTQEVPVVNDAAQTHANSLMGANAVGCRFMASSRSMLAQTDAVKADVVGSEASQQQVATEQTNPVWTWSVQSGRCIQFI